MDNDHDDDRPHLAVPHSPISHRRRSRPASRMHSRRGSMSDEPNERTSLLGRSRSHVKISDAPDSPRTPRTPRNVQLPMGNSFLGSL